MVEYKFIRIERQSPKPGRKTSAWCVYNRKSGVIIGDIEWYGPWRQFCFMPRGDTVWSSGCLRDIVHAIAWISEGYRSRKAKESQP